MAPVTERVGVAEHGEQAVEVVLDDLAEAEALGVERRQAVLEERHRGRRFPAIP